MQKAHKGEGWGAALKGRGQLDHSSEQEVNKKLMLERFQAGARAFGRVVTS